MLELLISTTPHNEASDTILSIASDPGVDRAVRKRGAYTAAIRLQDVGGHASSYNMPHYCLTGAGNMPTAPCTEGCERNKYYVSDAPHIFP